MKKVLVLGVGLVAGPLVRYLQKQQGIQLTLADLNFAAAQKWAQNSATTRAVALDVSDAEQLDALVGEHDVIVSLLPAPKHPTVARVCLKHSKHLLTASYNGDELRGLDSDARHKGLTILGECGLDPGLDHMSAMQIIERVQRRGGRVLGFRSYCGGLPAPEANNNPIGYKFSWSPRGVLTAATASARFRQDGHVLEVAGDQLFRAPEVIEIAGLPQLEGYPNRDSLPYQALYGLNDATTMLRGTLRHKGHCAQWYPWVQLGLFSQESFADARPTSHRAFTAAMTDAGAGDPRAALAQMQDLPPDHPAVRSLEWLGAFESTPLPEGASAPVDVLAALMLEKCQYAPAERDMVVLRHDFDVEVDGAREQLASTLVAYGEPGGDSAMARTVGLPLAIATRLVLENIVTERGVIAPILPEIFEPILNELAAEGIAFEEKSTPTP